MGYSKDPVKRRRQLEALARNNPRIDIDALLAKHELTDPTASRVPPAIPARLPSMGSTGHWWHTPAAGADFDVEDGQLAVIFWPDAADDEHPMLGVPITNQAALDLVHAVERSLELEDEDPAQPIEEIYVEELRAHELDEGSSPDLGPVDLLMTDVEGRTIVAHLSAPHARALKKLNTVNWLGRPNRIAVDSDGQKLSDEQPWAAPERAG